MSLRKRKRALVLGCGPAGLFAAHALNLKAWDFKVYSKVVRQSEMFGAQYLHQGIPGLSESEPRTLGYSLRGTASEYRAKVYGPESVPSVSPTELVGLQPAYDIREAYGRAWDFYEGCITGIGEINAEVLMGLALDYRPDRIFSSIPAPALCRSTHGFQSRMIYAIGDAPERGVECPVTVPEMSVVCNGEEHPRWYRASNVFGYRTAEWPAGPKPPVKGVAEVRKPIRTDCVCFMDIKGFTRVGRYGRWQKGVLAHTAYYSTFASL